MVFILFPFELTQLKPCLHETVAGLIRQGRDKLSSIADPRKAASLSSSLSHKLHLRQYKLCDTRS